MSLPYRVLVASALADRARDLETGVPAAVAVADPASLVSAARHERPDVVVLDVDALDLAPALRAAVAGVRIAVLAEAPTLDDAVRAVRCGTHDFLDGRGESLDLPGAVRRLADDLRAERASTRRPQSVLAVGAHPDDVESGVGGILAAHRAAGDAVTILTLSRGRREGGVELAFAEANASATVIGARLLFEDEPMAFTPLLSAISRHVDQLRPTIVYTHSKHDRRQDHRVVHEATVAATEEVATVACFQGTTGTTSFKPTRFVPIDGVVEFKLQMLASFASRGSRPEYLAPDFVLAAARYWSQYGHGAHCEPLEIIRESIASPVSPAGVEPFVAENVHTGEFAAVA